MLDKIFFDLIDEYKNAKNEKDKQKAKQNLIITGCTWACLLLLVSIPMIFIFILMKFS